MLVQLHSMNHGVKKVFYVFKHLFILAMFFHVFNVFFWNVFLHLWRELHKANEPAVGFICRRLKTNQV